MISPCPFCGSTNVERHYARVEREAFKVPLENDGSYPYVEPLLGNGIEFPPRLVVDATLTIEELQAVLDYWKAWLESGTQPGCLECEETRPLEEWVRLVEERRAG